MLKKNSQLLDLWKKKLLLTYTEGACLHLVPKISPLWWWGREKTRVLSHSHNLLSISWKKRGWMNDIILDNLVTKFSIMDLLSIFQPSLLYLKRPKRKKKQTNFLSLINNTFVAEFVASIWHHTSSTGLYGFFCSFFFFAFVQRKTHMILSQHNFAQCVDFYYFLKLFICCLFCWQWMPTVGSCQQTDCNYKQQSSFCVANKKSAGSWHGGYKVCISQEESRQMFLVISLSLLLLLLVLLLHHKFTNFKSILFLHFFFFFYWREGKL